MTGIRRALLLAGLTVAVFLAGPAAAQAAFTDGITTPAVSISTATVAAPTNVVPQAASCDNSRNQTVRLTWTDVSGVSHRASVTLREGPVG